MPLPEIILDQIRAIGYQVSTYQIPASLLRTIPAIVEMHAIDTRTNPATQHIAKVEASEHESHYRCAVLLAEMVGIDLD